MPEKTLTELTLEAHRAIVGLEELVKRQQRISNTRWLALLLFIPVMFLVSSAVTISTISHCFLNERVSNGSLPASCQLIPGYEKALTQNKEIYTEFERLRGVTDSNKARIDELEKKIEELSE